jgi:para-nitrobenzyl esterase
VAPWSGTRDATSFGRPCAQPDQGWNSPVAARSSENCLYLNVFTPKPAAGAHLPVMVWIHGGGFTGGAGGDPAFAGDHLIAQGIVLVSINYRLGVFGFLALPQRPLAAGASSSGNFGLEDQVAALKWVRANIANFGGDPANITIFGQSAGGGSVLDLLTSPLTSGLVRHAIIESGVALGIMPTASLADAERIGARFAQGSTVEQLRAMSTGAVMRRYAAFMRQGPRNQLGPIVDGRVLPEDPMAVFARHGELAVPLIIGNNAREGFGRIPDRALPEAIRRAYGAGADEALALYGFGHGAEPNVDPVLGGPGPQFLTDTTFRCGAVITAVRHASAGAPVWEYQFEQSLPGRHKDGAAHSYELPYVFGNLLQDGFLGGAYGPRDRALSNVMVRYWTDFARTGDPNEKGVPHWPRFEPSTRAFMRFSTAFPDDEKVGHRLRGDLCDLLGRNLTPHR